MENLLTNIRVLKVIEDVFFAMSPLLSRWIRCAAMMTLFMWLDLTLSSVWLEESIFPRSSFVLDLME